MAFPLSIAGEFRMPRDGYDRTTPEQICFRVVHMLEKASATKVAQTGSTVEFYAGMFRQVWKGNILQGIDYGRVTVSDTGDALLVEYEFRLWRSLFLSVVMTSVLTYVLMTKRPPLPEVHGINPIWFMPVGLIVLLCVNFIFASLRLAIWLKRGCQDGWGSWL